MCVCVHVCIFVYLLTIPVCVCEHACGFQQLYAQRPLVEATDMIGEGRPASFDKLAQPTAVFGLYYRWCKLKGESLLIECLCSLGILLDCPLLSAVAMRCTVHIKYLWQQPL